MIQHDQTRVPHRQGVTLLEVIISLILVSTVILLSMSASANLMRTKTVTLDSIRGHELAFQILDEVTATAFQDQQADRTFGREPSETAANRTDFDDVDDYHNYASSPPTQRTGTAMADLSGWSIRVNVTPAKPTATGIMILPSGPAPLRLVTVTSVAPSGVQSSESMLISEVASDAPNNLSHETWRRMTLTFPNARTIEVTAPHRNVPQAVSN